MIKLGELDTSLEDVNGYLQQVEDELSELDNVHGDPKYLETHIKKLKVLCHSYIFAAGTLCLKSTSGYVTDVMLLCLKLSNHAKRGSNSCFERIVFW